MKISFLGDISLDGYYKNYPENGKIDFSLIHEELACSNYVFANLESTVDGDNEGNPLKNPKLKTSVESLNILNEIGVTHVSIANNHVYDNLNSGFVKTVAKLNELEIPYTGASDKPNCENNYFLLQNDDIKVAILSSVTLDTNPGIPENSNIYINIFDEKKIAKQVSELQNKVDYVILYIHWGGRTEYGSIPDFEQPKIAKRLFESGVDLIVGHHSHTYQCYEKVDQKFVFYSLGNFIFSDFWSDGKFIPIRSSGKHATVLNVRFTKENYQVSTKHYLNELSKFTKYSYKNSYHYFLNKIVLSFKPFWLIYYFNLKVINPVVFFLSRGDLTMGTKCSRLFHSIRKRII